MRYWTATLLGVGLFFASLVTFSIELTRLLDAGTCASGNQPFVIANECPSGTGTTALLLAGSILGLLVAAGIVAARGVRPWSGVRGSFLILHGWAIFFSASGAVSAGHALTSAGVGSDGRTGGIIVGAIFLIMGLPVLAFVLVDMIAKVRGRDERPAFPGAPGGLAGRAISKLIGSRIPPPVAQASARPSSGFGRSRDRSPTSDTTLDQLERLQRLRDQGALSEAEFTVEKSRILGG